MKKIVSLLAFVIFASTAALAQNGSGSVKGRLVDSTSKQFLGEATVSVTSKKDSSMAGYTLPNKQGFFEIKELEAGTYTLHVSFQGYEPVKRSFIITPQKPVADLGEIKMSTAYKSLKEVIVTDESPIKIKEDTVEFKADAFKTKPNATVEDLLKKVPGVQVSKDGTVTAQGETVQKVYVDGKEFFGNDPKLATKNLTADMVESVQVFDDMSDQAKFTKIDDGSKQKAINIKLKKDKKKGLFGRVLGAGGTDSRYEGNVSLNRFNGDKQFSLLANANNLNKQGFSFNDVVTAMGGMQNMMNSGNNSSGGGGGFGGGMQVSSSRGGGFMGMGGGTSSGGITRSISTGLNFNTYLSKKIKLGSNYFFSDTKNNQEKNVFRKTLWSTDSTTEMANDVRSTSDNQNHRFNVRLEYQIDSANSILYTPSLTLQHSTSASFDTSSTFTIEPAAKYLALTGFSDNRSERNGVNLTNNLLFRHRFRRVGRTITVGYTNTYGKSDAESFAISSNNFFDELGVPFRSIDQNRNTFQKTKTNNNVLSTSYTEPFGKDKLLELNYAYTRNNNTSDRKTYDYDAGTGKYATLNLPLTNYFENLYTANRIGANFRVQKKKYNYQVGSAIQFSTLRSMSRLATAAKDSLTTQSFVNFFPSANFNYQPTKTKSIRFNYRGRTNQPTISQLQNVIDISNPLQLRTGNPDLGQEFTHNLNLGYNTFNFFTFKFFAVNFNFSTTQNKIVNSIDTVSKGVQIVKPVNLDGSYNTFGFVTLGLPFKNKKLKGSSLNFTTAAFYNNDVSLLYKQKNITKTLTLTQSAGANFSLLKNKMDVGVNGSVSYYNVGYTVNKQLSEDYFTQTYSVDFAYQFNKGITFSTDFDYYINSGRANGFNQRIPLWNASIAKQILKSKAAELKFSVNDILNQNQSITRTAAENYVEDTRSIVLRRYFMVSLLYNINKMAGKNMQMPMPKMMQRNMNNLRVNY